MQAWVKVGVDRCADGVTAGTHTSEPPGGHRAGACRHPIALSAAATAAGRGKLGILQLFLPRVWVSGFRTSGLVLVPDYMFQAMGGRSPAAMHPTGDAHCLCGAGHALCRKSSGLAAGLSYL